MKRMVKAWVLFISAVISPDAFCGVGRIPPQVKFEHIYPSQVEAIDYINSITQDSEGYMWFGAVKGLMRYDGYDLKKYIADPLDKSSLSSSLINNLTLLHNGQLWVSTAEGLCLYKPSFENFDCITQPQDQQGRLHSFSSMFEDSRGTVWVGSSMGVKILDTSKRTLLPPPAIISQTLPPLANSDANIVYDMLEDSQGNLWFGSQDNGLVRYNYSSGQVSRFTKSSAGQFKLSGNKVRTLLLDSNDTFWVGTFDGGLSFFNTSTHSFELLDHSNTEKSKEVWDVLEDSKGLLWIGDGDGVHLFDSTSGKIVQYRYEEGSLEGPGNFVVRDLFMDRAKGVWLGYFPSGVDKVDIQASQFQNYRHKPQSPDSLADGGVLTTLEDKQGNIWVGCGFGLSYLNRQTQQFQRFVHDKADPSSLSGSTILDLVAEPDGTLWVGAWDRGLNRRDPVSGQFARYQFDPNKPNSLLGREPWALALDDDGGLWVGTEMGFNHYRKETDDFEQFFPLDINGKPSTRLYIRKLYIDSSGTLWIGSFNGLYAFDIASKTFSKHYVSDSQKDDSLSSNEVLSIYEDQQGDFWVGTSGGGLNLMDRQTGTFKRYGISEGLPDMSVSGIVDDLQGDLWISTFQGLARLNKQTQTFTVFEKRDGLLGNQYNRNSPSRLRSGELVFGSTRGLTIFDPSSLQSNDHPPPVVFTNFSIFNEPVAPGPNSPLKKAIGQATSISLKHHQSVISIGFAGLDYVSPEENQYAYRLHGFEQSWNHVGNRRSATYTNLDPGSYSFQVKAANSAGVWNTKPAALKITVAPPFWQTPLAYITYILLFIGVLARTWHVQQAKLAFERQKYEQERAVVKRLQELDQLKDEINRELDRKVAERTEALNQEHERLLAAQDELQTLNEKLEEASLTDPLTGLKNRRFLHQTIHKDLAIAERVYQNALTSQQSLSEQLNDMSFIMLDVDKFKEVNDKHGHNAGDAVLVQLSEVIKKELRQSDYLIRWGGEEFVVVVRHSPRKLIASICQRIRAAIAAHHFLINDGEELYMTCSMGFASFPFVKTQPFALTWEQVINFADRALYCAKTSGRDCWVGLEFNPKADDNSEQLANLLSSVGGQKIQYQIERQRLRVQSSKPIDSLIW